MSVPSFRPEWIDDDAPSCRHAGAWQPRQQGAVQVAGPRDPRVTLAWPTVRLDARSSPGNTGFRLRLHGSRVGMQGPFARLFGAALLRSAQGVDVPLVAQRRDQLLAYLACCNRWATRDELAELFWPDRGRSAARSNLRYVLL